jgi:hypothetical protein
MIDLDSIAKEFINDIGSGKNLIEMDGNRWDG